MSTAIATSTTFDMGPLAKSLPTADNEVVFDFSKLLDDPIVEASVIAHLLEVAAEIKAETTGITGVDDSLWVKVNDIDVGELEEGTMDDLESWAEISEKEEPKVNDTPHAPSIYSKKASKFKL